MNPCKWIFIAVLAATVAGDTGENVQNMGFTFVDKPKLIPFRLSSLHRALSSSLHAKDRVSLSSS